MLDDNERAIAWGVILKNIATTRAAEQFGIKPAKLVQMLVGMLDKLCDHFDIGERPRRRAA